MLRIASSLLRSSSGSALKARAASASTRMLIISVLITIYSINLEPAPKLLEEFVRRSPDRCWVAFFQDLCAVFLFGFGLIHRRFGLRLLDLETLRIFLQDNSTTVL